MPVTRPRGTTVVELLVALGIFGVLSLAVISVARRAQNAYRVWTQQMDRRQNLRAAAAFLRAETVELDAADGDVIALAPTALTIRAPRQLAVLCRDAIPVSGSPGLASLTVHNSLRFGVRDFDPDTDSLWILDARGQWIPAGVSATGAAPCDDGTPGRRLTVTMSPATGFSRGTPVLGFEDVTYRLYRSSEDGRWYIGQGTATDFQPVAGPVTSNGLSFAFSDSSGSATTDGRNVTLIEIRVRAAVSEPIRDAAGLLVMPLDSVTTVVALRNNRRRG